MVDGSSQPDGPGTGYAYDLGIYTNPHVAGSPVGRGTYYWGGLYGTVFWVDPVNDLIFVGMAQTSYFNFAHDHGQFAAGAPNLLGMLQAATYSGLLDPAR